MELLEAINKRKSIRDFTGEPVSKATIREILEIAVRAPSGANCQAWEFAVIGGEVLEKLKEANIKTLYERFESNDVPRDNFEKGSVYHGRQVDLAKQLFNLMDIPRHDVEKRLNWFERGFRFFNAPVAIVLMSDKSLPNKYQPLDVGAAMYGICLVALEFGLGTCIEEQGKAFQEVLREIANIPDTKNIHTTIAIGHPNWDFPANQITTEREAIDNNTSWCGF